MDRSFLKGRNGDAANALLAAIGYNFRLLIAWIALLWAVIQKLSSETTDVQFT
jgi:IS5 family transposase